MLGGFTLFMVVMVSVLLAAGQTFSDLKPNGSDALNQLPQATQPTPPVVDTSACGPIGVLCGAINTLGNGLAVAGKVLSIIFGTIFGFVTFDVPAFNENPYLQIVRLALLFPLILVIVYFIFRLVKSVIPFVGGDTD